MKAVIHIETSKGIKSVATIDVVSGKCWSPTPGWSVTSITFADAPGSCPLCPVRPLDMGARTL